MLVPPRGMCPFQGEGMGTLRAGLVAQTPLNGGHWATPQYPCSQIKVRYSKNQYFQQWCHMRKNRGILQAWYYEVWCIKYHYPELVVWESIVRSLKGAVVDMAQYMGPTTSMSHILQTLAVISGTVASFDILMQNFYRVTQGNHEKVPSFAMRLEGNLNQFRLQWPGRMTDLEVQQHLKDCLFHGVCKHIWDSIRYLYSTPGTSYLQLIVATWKAESENEGIWDKVRSRAAVATNCGKGATELGQQIANLMVALTKAGQGSNSASAPSSPWKRGCGRGHADRGTPGHPSSHNGQTSLGQTVLDQTYLLAAGQGLP